MTPPDSIPPHIVSRTISQRRAPITMPAGGLGALGRSINLMSRARARRRGRRCLGGGRFATRVGPERHEVGPERHEVVDGGAARGTTVVFRDAAGGCSAGLSQLRTCCVLRHCRLDGPGIGYALRAACCLSIVSRDQCQLAPRRLAVHVWYAGQSMF